ncbi:MAG: hypothetical protein PVSMB6_04240 [Steroidobacteraceae bacterium]
MKFPATAIGLAAVAICAGCETETPYLDSQLGKSTARMIEAQTLDSAAAANPPALAPAGADGQRIKNAVDVYHGEVNKEGKSVSRQVGFEAGK